MTPKITTSKHFLLTKQLIQLKLWNVSCTNYEMCLVRNSKRSTSSTCRCSHPKLFWGKGVLKICSKFIEHQYRNVISIKLPCKFIEIALPHECSSVNLLHIFRHLLYKNTSGKLLLNLTAHEISLYNLL